uniref:Uncharacterized protein n=1 Tax=Trichuris muris TaxID=70415 RepID=A0A5S6QS89_TRIMR
MIVIETNEVDHFQQSKTAKVAPAAHRWHRERCLEEPYEETVCQRYPQGTPSKRVASLSVIAYEAMLFMRSLDHVN